MNRRGQIPTAELLELRTAHDVRRLCVCHGCRQLGDRRNMIELKRDARGEHRYFHGRCYVKSYRLARLLALPSEQLERLTLGDVGVYVMQKIVQTTRGRQ